MTNSYQPTLKEMERSFTAAVGRAGGADPEIIRFDDQLFGRAVLPCFAEVSPGDRFQGGVAIRVRGDTVRVQPYTFREVCRNGAMSAWILDQQEVKRCGPEATPWEATEVLSQIEQLVEMCGEEHCLEEFVARAKMAQILRPDPTLSLLSYVEQGPSAMRRGFVELIVRRFERQSDSSLYGLLNAVTSVARDVEDPAVRWGMEEFGGGVLARLPACPTPSGHYAAR